MRRKCHQTISLLFISCTFALSNIAHAEIKKKLDEPAAHHLLNKAYGKIGGGAFEYGPDMSKVFYEYQGLGAPGTEGSFGFFAVNPWTGDVWNLWGCHKLSTPALRASQAKIRQRFTPDELKQYDRLSRLKPFCTVEN